MLFGERLRITGAIRERPLDAWDKLFKDPTKSKNYTKEQILNFRNEIETKIFGNSTGTIPDR